MVDKIFGGVVFSCPPYSWSERMDLHKLNGNVATMVIGSRPPLLETPTSTEPQTEVKKPRRKKSRSS